MLIGYARVSTDDQNLNLQMDALQQAGCVKIYSDHIGGVKAARPGLAKALEVARTGDVILVWRLDRLGRSLKDLIEIMSMFDERGIGLSSLQESITTTNNSGRLIFHLFGALAEFERNLIRERTTAGFVAARARGHKGGRPKALDPAKRQLAVKLYTEGQYTIIEMQWFTIVDRFTAY
ncbi:resolvase domain protein (plasmid) [Fischerella sp. NIES-4106]|nr:resolvase domain protein [Fischerella sp. NIES-4106]